MSSVHALLSQHIPHRHKTSPRGWLMFNAPCCHHRGHKRDSRMRGNLLFVADGHIAYNCYNCGFKTVYESTNLSKNFEQLLKWMGVPEDAVMQIKLEILQNKILGIDNTPSNPDLLFMRDFKEIPLPEGARPIQAVMEDDNISSEFISCIDYLSSRGSAVGDNWDYYWSSSTKWDLHKRIILPFYYKNMIVGWTARYAGKPPAGTPRYYNSSLQTGYLFNCDALDKPTRKYVLLVEGPLDAIAVDGVAALGSTLSKQQRSWLRDSDKEIIVLPDRQATNQGLIDVALEEGWSVSFPDWEEDIKDAADASCRYGRLYTLRSAIESRTNSSIEIGIKRRRLR